MIPDTIMCFCGQCDSNAYSVFNQQTNCCEGGHSQKTSFLQIGAENYIFGCKKCEGGQPYEEPYCQTCDTKFKKVDRPDQKTGNVKPLNYQKIYTLDEIEIQKDYMDSIERPVQEELIVSENVCPHCVDAHESSFKIEQLELEMFGYFSTAPKGEFDDLMYAPHGICSNSKCINIAYPDNRFAMGVKLVPRTELESDELQSEHYCKSCEEETRSISNIEIPLPICAICSEVKSELGIEEQGGSAKPDLEFVAKSAYSIALREKEAWLNPPFVYSVADNFQVRAKSLDKANEFEKNSDASGLANDWWFVLGPYLRELYSRKGKETYEQHVFLTAYLMKSTNKHIEPLWWYSSRHRTGAGERKIRSSFELYDGYGDIFTSLLQQIKEVSSQPQRLGIESFVANLERMVFWPIGTKQKQDFIERANHWCFKFTQSPIHQKYLATCMIQDPYTLGGELKNPIGLIESFSILAALEEFAPDQRWIVQEKLYPKTEMADWKNVLNDEGRMFVKNIDIIIKKFNS